MFFNETKFSILRQLQRDWETCLREFDGLGEEDLLEWPEPLLDSGCWCVFGLFGMGETIPENCRRCPRTAEMVVSIPGLTMAGYSVLRPGTCIRPHYGYTREVLRAHLGLRIPDNCGIRVENEVRQWKAGEWLVFDDTLRHEAWNRSREDRVVLLVDFRRDTMDCSFGETDGHSGG